MYDHTVVDTLDFHHSMLLDEVRTRTFLQAILRAVKPGDVVLDIGSGTGILALFACLAGASHVYAVEEGSVIEIAEQVCRDNGFEERVTFLQDWSTNVELPERANVLVTETTDAHLARLHDAGFSHCDVWMKHLNFVSFVAIR